MDLARFRQKPLLGILRGIREQELEPVLEAAVAGGLESLEITLNTVGAPELIARAREIAGARLTIGAGTVLDLDGLKAALDAGATFIVSPTRVPDVVAECVRRSVPVFPGALTPQEIHDAWRAGASLVKVFPAQVFGPGYFREVKGPFDDIGLLACGGVNAETLRDYAAAGADAFAVGAGTFRPEWIRAGAWGDIERAVRALIEVLAERAARRPD